MMMWFLSLILLTRYIVFHKSNQPHTSDINSAESWCIILTLPDSDCGDFIDDFSPCIHKGY